MTSNSKPQVIRKVSEGTQNNTTPQLHWLIESQKVTVLQNSSSVFGFNTELHYWHYCYTSVFRTDCFSSVVYFITPNLLLLSYLLFSNGKFIAIGSVIINTIFKVLIRCHTTLSKSYSFKIFFSFKKRCASDQTHDNGNDWSFMRTEPCS